MRKWVGGILGGLLAIAMAGSPLPAQRERALETGLAVVRFPDDDRWIVGPWLRATAERDALSGSSRGAATVIASSTGLSAFGDASATRRGQAGTGRLAWEAGGEAAGLIGSVSRPHASLRAMGRLLWPVHAGGVWLRATGHAAHRELGTLSGQSVDAGAWWRASHATFTAEVTRQGARGQLYAGGRAIGVVPVRYLEGSVGAHAQGALGWLDASAGARRDPDAVQRVEPLFSVSAVLQTGEHMGVTFALSRQPADYVRGADALQSASVGLRFAGRRPASATVQRAGIVAELAAAGDDRPRRLRVRMPRAHTVEVMGDFTDWIAVPLSPDRGDFVLPVPLPSGTHRLLLRIDGGAWSVPANTPAVDDDLGGRVGLMVVP